MKRNVQNLFSDVQVQTKKSEIKYICVWCLIISSVQSIFKPSSLSREISLRLSPFLRTFFFSALQLNSSDGHSNRKLCVGFIYRSDVILYTFDIFLFIHFLQGCLEALDNATPENNTFFFINTNICTRIKNCVVAEGRVPLSLAKAFSCSSSRLTCVMIESI